jgi:hypothetical protein
MSALALAPGVAHREVRAELWLLDMDGRGLRPVTMDQASRLVAEGAAYPRIGQNGVWREVRLKVALPPHSRRTFIEHPSAASGNHGAHYEHNHRACNLWKH